MLKNQKQLQQDVNKMFYKNNLEYFDGILKKAVKIWL